MNEPILSEARLLELLSQVRAEIETEAQQIPETPDSHPISFARARELALNPARWTEAERAHVAVCHRCAHLAAEFERQMVHPSQWALILWAMGLGSVEERRRMRYHIEEGQCRQCQERLRLLDSWLTFFRHNLPVHMQMPPPEAKPVRVRIRNPKAMRTDTSERIEMSVISPDERLEGDFIEDEEGKILTLEARSQDAALNHHLLSYALVGAEDRDPVIGYLVLRPDVNNWYAATTALSYAEIFDRLSGPCSVLLLSVEADQLTQEDREPLLESAQRARLDEAATEAWRAWAQSVMDSTSAPNTAKTLACEVRQLLQA